MSFFDYGTTMNDLIRWMALQGFTVEIKTMENVPYVHAYKTVFISKDEKESYSGKIASPTMERSVNHAIYTAFEFNPKLALKFIASILDSKVFIDDK